MLLYAVSIDTDPELLLARILDGFRFGAGYGALALALVMIYKATGVLNFAQGELALLGIYLTWALGVGWGWPIFVSIFIAMIATSLLAAGIERTVIRPFDPRNHLPLVIVTLGLFLAINSFVAVTWSTDLKALPSVFPSGDVFSAGVAHLSWSGLGIFLSALAMLGAVNLLLSRTKIGLAFRAVSSNLESAELVGIRVGPTLQFGWALAAAIGTLAGALLVPELEVLDPNVMLSTLVFAFAGAALGGLDSPKGAIVGGILVGLIRSVVVQSVSFIPSELSVGAAVFVILLVLLVKPSGLYGSSKVVRV